MIDLLRFRKEKGIKQKEISEVLGCTQQNVYYFEKNKKGLSEEQMSKLAKRYGEDLISDYMIRDTYNVTNSPYSAVNSPNANISHIEGEASQDAQVEEVPLVPASLQKVRDVDILDYVQNNDVTQLPEIKQFPTFDMYYEVTGESMMPNLMPADRLGLRRVERELPILNGHTYVIDTSSLGIFVCNLYDNGDEFQCRFNNTERFGEVVIPKNDVINVFEVVGMYRLNV